MGVRVGMARAQFMIGNGAKQNPDIHPEKGKEGEEKEKGRTRGKVFSHCSER
jgi:hypothetical protein